VGKSKRKVWPWIVGAVVVLLLAVTAVFVLPILLHQDGGQSTVVESGDEWPLSATAIGDDGRTRTIDVHSAEPGGTVDTSSLEPGQHIVVSGTGFDTGQGIYVALCKIPDAGDKPGPCLGGVPSTETGTFTAYLELPPPTGEGVDCQADACGIFTRNDHTALNDRVQDVHLPVGFVD
jgi:hypothetical protein